VLGRMVWIWRWWPVRVDETRRRAVRCRCGGWDALRDVCAKQGAETVYEQSALAVAC
jgi:hypothetical protein